MKGTDLFKRFHSSVGCKTKTEDAKKIQKPINQWSNQNTEQTVASAREKSGAIYYQPITKLCNTNIAKVQ